MLTLVYLCSPMLTRVYLCLLVFTRLRQFSRVYLCLALFLVLVHLRLPMFTHVSYVYNCLPMFTPAYS